MAFKACGPTVWDDRYPMLPSYVDDFDHVFCRFWTDLPTRKNRIESK